LFGVGSLQIPVAGSQTWSVMIATWCNGPTVEDRRLNAAPQFRGVRYVNV
jgi:hypothetical protein